MDRVTPLWLSHHWPEHYDRCVLIGRVHVCRRCLVLYPTLLAVAALTAALLPPDASTTRAWWTAAVWILPLPMVAEWCAEHLLGVAYSAVRQVVSTAVAAPGLGLLFAAYLAEPLTAAVLAPAIVYTSICALSALAGAVLGRSDAQADRWQDDHDEAERARRDRLISMFADSGDHSEPR